MYNCFICLLSAILTATQSWPLIQVSSSCRLVVASNPHCLLPFSKYRSISDGPRHPIILCSNLNFCLASLNLCEGRQPRFDYPCTAQSLAPVEYSEKKTMDDGSCSLVYFDTRVRKDHVLVDSMQDSLKSIFADQKQEADVESEVIQNAKALLSVFPKGKFSPKCCQTPFACVRVVFILSNLFCRCQ